MSNKQAPPDPTRVTHENITAIFEHEKEQVANASLGNRIALWVTNIASNVWFIVFHVVFFIGWIAINLTDLAFDPYPFVALITIVSLESIFLSCFVLVSQKTQTIEADKRHKLDLQINLLAERESTVLMRVLEKVANKLGIPENELKEIKLLSDDTNPTDVLEQIVEVEEKDPK